MRIFLTFLVANALAYGAVKCTESHKTPEPHSSSHATHTSTAVKSPPSAHPPSREVQASFPKPVRENSSPQSVETQSAADFCDTLDLVAHPEQAEDMVRFTGAQYETPPGLLNGIWHTESNHGINGQTGSCNVMSQFTIRDCWKPGTTTRRPKGCTSPYVFAGETASESRWKTPTLKVGNGTLQKQSIIRIAKALGFNPWSIRGSCGNRTLTGIKDPNKNSSHGGCFGNMQITPSEWEADTEAMGYGLSELSPFNLCDSMLVSSYRLKKHHDKRLRKYVKKLGKESVTNLHDKLSWLWSGRRYYGGPDKSSSDKYQKHFKHGREDASFSCGWKCWNKMDKSQDFSPLTSYIQKRGNTLRKLRN